jgi:non-specific serine/threonine protein kinase
MGGTVASMVEKLPATREIDRRHDNARYPIWMARRILKHALSGLAFLHQNGVVHGDIQAGNFLFSARDLDSLEEERLKQSESHITAPLRRRDGKTDRWAPKNLMLPQPLYEYVELGPEMFIKISDFGAGKPLRIAKCFQRVNNL